MLMTGYTNNQLIKKSFHFFGVAEVRLAWLFVSFWFMLQRYLESVADDCIFFNVTSLRRCREWKMPAPANRFVQQKMPRLGHWVAERKGFEPSIRFWRIHTFQACSFDHSDTSLRRCKDSYCWVILAQWDPNSSDKDVSWNFHHFCAVDQSSV